MRVLLDENVPVDLAHDLPGHDTSTVRSRGWSGLRNGDLLRRATGTCDAFLTMDSNLEYQQQLVGYPFGILIVRAASNRMLHLKPLIPAIQEALTTLEPGKVCRVGG